MKPVSLLVLICLSTLTRCIATTSSLKPKTPSNIPQDQDESVLPKLIPLYRRNHPRVHDRHRPGEPYLKDKVYFRWELPEDTTGFIATGYYDIIDQYRQEYRKARSINPKTGEPRKGIGSCGGLILHDELPEDYECCETTGYLFCRTYKIAKRDVDDLASPPSWTDPYIEHPHDDLW